MTINLLILIHFFRLMGHMKHKVSKILSKHGGKHDSHICLSCFKVFETRYLLDCHTTTVHTYENSTRTKNTFNLSFSLDLYYATLLNEIYLHKYVLGVCRICKEDFKTERTFFSHMKDLHGFKEMPYICKVCKFQSSHYDDIISHYK